MHQKVAKSTDKNILLFSSISGVVYDARVLITEWLWVIVSDTGSFHQPNIDSFNTDTKYLELKVTSFDKS